MLANPVVWLQTLCGSVYNYISILSLLLVGEYSRDYVVICKHFVTQFPQY